jgi:carbonic anhydrase
MKIMTQKDLRQIVDRTLVVVQLGATWLERAHGTEVIRQPGYRATLIEVAIVLNAGLTAYGMRPGLNLGTREGIDVVYGVYLLEERLVWAPRPEASDWFGLAPAPHDPNEFVTLCDLLTSCERVQTLLDGP